MKNIPLAIICVFIVVVAHAQQPLSPEQQKLSIIKGSWTVPGSEDEYLEVCEFIEGNHLQCVSTSKEADGVHKSISYLSYNAPEKCYVYYGLYSGGSSRTLKGQWKEDHFLFEGDRNTPDAKIRWRVTMRAAGPNLDFLEERSVNDGPWKETTKFQYKRIR